MKTSLANKDLALEILISTTNRTSISFLKRMFPHEDIKKLYILIINQTVKGKELNSEFKNIRVINSFELGLSKSRNLAINNAKGDICLIADDDVEYIKGFQKVIKSAFNRLQNPSVIKFKIETFSNKEYKTYPKKSKRLYNKKSIETISSIEIAFKRKQILSNNILFNKLFGLGSYFPSGEEYLFLKEALSKGLVIYFENKAIVKHAVERSTSNFASTNFIKTKAALYYHDYNNFCYLFLLKFIFFLYRKNLIRFKDFNEKLKIGVDAVNDYKGLIKMA